MTTRKPRQSQVRNATSIVGGSLYFEDVCQCHMSDDIFSEIIEDKTLKAIRVVSLSSDWNEQFWVSDVGYMEQNINIEMTLRKEKRGQLFHWYAYRRKAGRLYKRYVGKSEDLTERRLAAVAMSMP